MQLLHLAGLQRDRRRKWRLIWRMSKLSRCSGHSRLGLGSGQTYMKASLCSTGTHALSRGLPFRDLPSPTLYAPPSHPPHSAPQRPPLTLTTALGAPVPAASDVRNPPVHTVRPTVPPPGEGVLPELPHRSVADASNVATRCDSQRQQHRRRRRSHGEAFRGVAGQQGVVQLETARSRPWRCVPTAVVACAFGRPNAAALSTITIATAALAPNTFTAAPVAAAALAAGTSIIFAHCHIGRQSKLAGAANVGPPMAGALGRALICRVDRALLPSHVAKPCQPPHLARPCQLGPADDFPPDRNHGAEPIGRLHITTRLTACQAVHISS